MRRPGHGRRSRRTPPFEQYLVRCLGRAPVITLTATMVSISGPGKRVTLRDVAREAGVSIKTASRVVNREPSVNETTTALGFERDHHPHPAHDHQHYRRRANHVALRRVQCVGVPVRAAVLPRGRRSQPRGHRDLVARGLLPPKWGPDQKRGRGEGGYLIVKPNDVFSRGLSACGSYTNPYVMGVRLTRVLFPVNGALGGPAAGLRI